jgi:NifU-like domain
MEFDKAVAELEALVDTLEREGDERALLLLQLVDAIHRPALERIAAGDTEHPIAQALLQMYDIASPDDEVLVEEALDEVRPYIHSHGGQVELLAVSDGVVSVGDDLEAWDRGGAPEALPRLQGGTGRGVRGSPGAAAAAD